MAALYGGAVAEKRLRSAMLAPPRQNSDYLLKPLFITLLVPTSRLTPHSDFIWITTERPRILMNEIKSEPLI